MRSLSDTVVGNDSSGGECIPFTSDEVTELHSLLAASGLGDISLRHRYSVVFVYPGTGVGDVYPELSGCSAQICTVRQEIANFSKHGIQVVGLSTMPTEPDDVAPSTFQVGRIPPDVTSRLIDIVERGGQRYALRTSFIIYPDGSGVRIVDIADSVGHVRKCLDLATRHRLHSLGRIAVAGLGRNPDAVQSSVELRDFLPNGADSVSIMKLDVKCELVCKMADPKIIADEANYMDRTNQLLAAHGYPRVFPSVVSICTEQSPGWYLMEAASSTSLADLVFEDAARTRIGTDGRHILDNAVRKLSNLYASTFRSELPAVARYHYLDRFLAIPEREDFRETFDRLFGGWARLDDMLARSFVLDGVHLCRSYQEQMCFLRENVGQLLQPVGAYLHGDVHLPNMLLDAAGRDIIFIDPRTVWDGNDVGDPGFGDPLYDFATLLHSLHHMSAILRAIDEGYTEALLHLPDEPSDVASPIPVHSGLLRLVQNPEVDWFTGQMVRVVPPPILGANWRARLHVGAANATLGWLKYARSVRTRHAWIAIFLATMYHLELARRCIEEDRKVPSAATAIALPA